VSLPARPATSTGAEVEVVCRAATSIPDLHEHHRVRHAVFVTEQGIFAPTDLDRHDGDPRTHRVLGLVDGVAAGAVRLYPLDGETGLWQGDRLAVLPEFRVHGLGGPLVRFAVRTAGELGGDVMLAHIQLPNVRFFERLGWCRDGDVEVYCGLAHQPMRIALR